MAIISLKRKYTDVEYILGIQKKDERITKAFFYECQKYYKEHFMAIFYDVGLEDEIFQESFIILWSEIEHRRIINNDDDVMRRDRYGCMRQLSCSLKTFLLSIARNKYHEHARQLHGFYFDDVAYASDQVEQAPLDDDSVEELKISLVIECLSAMPAGCKNLLTMFYCENKNYDTILEELNRYSSKDALKTRKNKCLNSLRERVGSLFEQYHLAP
jgi:DNA-directed RNA polymerase specialized sigma24 family protein